MTLGQCLLWERHRINGTGSFCGNGTGSLLRQQLMPLGQCLLWERHRIMPSVGTAPDPPLTTPKGEKAASSRRQSKACLAAPIQAVSYFTPTPWGALECGGSTPLSEGEKRPSFVILAPMGRCPGLVSQRAFSAPDGLPYCTGLFFFSVSLRSRRLHTAHSTAGYPRTRRRHESAQASDHQTLRIAQQDQRSERGRARSFAKANAPGRPRTGVRVTPVTRTRTRHRAQHGRPEVGARSLSVRPMAASSKQPLPVGTRSIRLPWPRAWQGDSSRARAGRHPTTESRPPLPLPFHDRRAAGRCSFRVSRRTPSFSRRE